MALGRWRWVLATSLVVACNGDDAGEAIASAGTSESSDSGGALEGGADEHGDASGELDPPATPPSSCGVAAIDGCASVFALAVLPDDRVVIAGAQDGPVLLGVDPDGSVAWTDSPAPRGSYQDLAVLPDGHVVGVGSGGFSMSSDRYGLARAFDGAGESAWSFGPYDAPELVDVLWWDAAQRLVVAAHDGSRHELWLLDADGILRGVVPGATREVYELAALRDGFVACSYDRLVRYGADLSMLWESDAVGWSCESLASDGERLVVAGDDAQLHSLADSSDVQWSVPVDDYLTDAAFLGDGRVVTLALDAATPASTLRAFSADGTQLWTVTEPLDAAPLPGVLAVDGDRIFLATPTVGTTSCIQPVLSCYELAEP